MSYKVPAFQVRSVFAGLWRPLLAAVLMAEAMWVVADRADGDHGWEALSQIAIAGTVGLIVYVAVLLVLHVPEVAGLARRLPGGRRGPVSPAEATG
jgi:hypothetical protein